jgi:hypothetical protein
MLELKIKKMSIKVEGKEYSFPYPTAKALSDMQMTIKEKGDDYSIQAMIDLVVKLGLDQEIAEMLQPEHYSLMFEEFNGKKKA